MPFRTVVWRSFAIVAALAATACGGKETTSPPPGPSAIALISGNNQTGTVGQAFPQALVVKVTDKAGAGVGGVSVTWSVTSGGGSLSNGATVTDAQGQAQVTWTAGTVAGSSNNSASATVTGLTGSPVTFTASATAGPPAQLVAVSGNNQAGVVAQALGQQLVAAAQDQYGNPSANVTVSWAVTAGGGTPSAATSTTDAQGHASVTWTLGTVAGTKKDTLLASAAGLVGSPVAFAASANPAAASQIALTSGNTQTGTVATALSQPLTVTVRDQYTNPVAGVTVTWSVTSGAGSTSANSVVTDQQGQASTTWTLGPGAGPQQVQASVSGLTGSPVTFNATSLAGGAAQIAAASGNGQTGTVDSDLSTPLVVLVTDAHSNPVAGVTVAWATSATGASVTPASVSSDSAGHAAATLHLGQSAGSNQDTVTATAAGLTGSPVRFTATALAGPATQLALAGGNNQSAPVGTALPTPYSVKATDAFGNGVSGVTVDWAVTSGGGSISPLQNTTDASGVAGATHTLGGTVGTETATATSSGLTGSPVAFTATATSAAISITGITPDTLVAGQTATIAGTNFSPTSTSDTVLIDGVQATVTNATTSSLVVTVGHYGCAPARLVTVSVKVGTQSAAQSSVPLHPEGFVNLAVGQEGWIQDPSSFCLEFRAAAAGPEAYLVGLSIPAESSSSVLPFGVLSEGGISAVPPAQLAALASSSQRPARQRSRGSVTPARISAAPLGGFAAPLSPGASFEPPSLLRLSRQARFTSAAAGRPSQGVWAARATAEGAVRAQERALARRAPGAAYRISGAAPVAPSAASTPAVGDTLALHVPNFDAANSCTSYDTVRAVVRVIGSAGIWVTDVTNPATDSLTLAEIQAYSDTFDTKIYPTDTSYFGHPSDVDLNGRIVIVLTIDVNKQQQGNLLGFVFGGDLFPAASCPESNGAEMYYGEVPDLLNQAGTGAKPKAAILSQMPGLIAHEFTHIIQISHRVVLANGVFMTSWEMEGQATFAEELNGHAFTGHTSGQNYGSNVVWTASDSGWYTDEMYKLGDYFGDLGPGNGQAANAPDQCTLFGNLTLSTPCFLAYFYGSSWSYQRFIGDQYGPTYPGGLAQLTRDWISKDVQLAGVPNVGALLGVNTDTLFIRWATMLAVDDLDNGTGTAWIPPEVRLTTWNLADIATYLGGTGWGWLSVPGHDFTTFGDARAVRGGSTAYTLLFAGGAHSAAGIEVVDPIGNLLSPALRPALWVIRLQ